MTVWRRAAPSRPGLPLSDLTRLQDTTRRLAADIEAATATGQRPDPALSAEERFAALKKDIAGTRARPCGPGTSQVVDHRLWELLSAAMHRAETQQLTDLVSEPATAS